MKKLKTVAFTTLGCKVNTYETDGLIQLFENNGFEIKDFNESSDIYIVNTCTVTNLSSRKSRQMLRRAKKTNLDSIVIAVGCYSQKEPETLEEMPEVDLIIGNNNKMNILEYIKEFLNDSKKKYLMPIEQEKEIENFNLETSHDKTRAFIRIQDGCNQFCSYCIIPYVRGRIRSKKREAVIKEVKTLVKNNYKEIVFTGIHVASYGKDLNENYDLIDLIKSVNDISGVERIRLSSIEPTYLNEENIIRLSNIKKVAQHFHLSLQSGSDGVLKRMNRKYTTTEYLEVVNNLRKYFKNPGITTDIIVAFPGESEKEFNETCSFVEKVKFSQIHVFKYSKREGTKAASMKNQIHGTIASKRSKKLIEIGKKFEKEYIEDKFGKKLEVLFESYDLKNQENSGLTSEYIKVFVFSKKDLTNKFKKVKIKSYNKNKVIGELGE